MTTHREQAVAALADAIPAMIGDELHLAEAALTYLDANPAAKAALAAWAMPDDGHLCCCLEGDDDDAHGRDRSLEQPFLRGRYSDAALAVRDDEEPRT